MTLWEGELAMTTALEPGLSTGYLEFQRRPEPMLGWFAKHLQ